MKRRGSVVAEVVPGSDAKSYGPVIAAHVDPKAEVTTDGDAALVKLAKNFPIRHEVNHSAKQFSVDGHHTNTVEAYNLLLQRAVMGVYHRLSTGHLQRYLDELMFRWNQRESVIRKPSVLTGKPRGKKADEAAPAPKKRKKAKLQWVTAVRPFEEQLADLLRGAVGRELRWDRERGSLRWPDPSQPRQKPRSPKPKSTWDPDEIPY